MSSLASIVASEGVLRRGDSGPAVYALQLALSQAGYRIGDDGDFGPRTEQVVRLFEQQHGIKVDGVVSPEVAGVLDAPHGLIVQSATPLIHATGLPHDDTASLIAFYGDPDEHGFEAQLVGVPTPFALTYEGHPWPHPIRFHPKCAPLFADAFDRIWIAAGKNPASAILHRISRFSGSYENRPVRGSSRKSCHAFGAALDVDADDLPMGHRVDPAIIPQPVVDAFDAAGLFWGNRYTGRPDPMHWQAAHE